MSTILDESVKQLNQTLTEIEVRRSILRVKAVDTSFVPIHQKLINLEANVSHSIEGAPLLLHHQGMLVTLLCMYAIGSTKVTQHLYTEDRLGIMGNALPCLASLYEFPYWIDLLTPPVFFFEEYCQQAYITKHYTLSSGYWR